MKDRFVWIIVVFLFLPFLLFSQTYTISGYITDKHSGETIISASVFESQTGKGTVSNAYGFYSLTLPQGQVCLTYSYVGYAVENRSFVLDKDTIIPIYFSESTLLHEVTVVGSKKELGVQSSQMSAIEVPIAQIKSVPTLFGETDVLKALQLLPGVQSGTEGSAGMYVRGGGPDENLLLLDGVPVYNVNHMFGFFSVFNADAVKNVTLYKGSFPARFGGRLSSVVDIRMNDGNMHEYHGNVSVGLISSKINVEGPIWKGKTSFNVSARRTYADILVQPFLKIVGTMNDMDRSQAGYYFYDVNAKITHRFSDKDRLFISYYMGDDAIYAKMRDKQETSENYSYSNWLKTNWAWGNIVAAARWNHIVSPKLFMNTSVNYTQYRYKMGIGAESKETDNNNTSLSETNLVYSSGINDGTAKVDFDYAPTPNHDMKFGVGYTYHTFRPGVMTTQMIETDSAQNILMDTTIGDQRVYSHETMLYVEDNMSLGHFFKGNIGLHYSTFTVQGHFYHSLQPRASVRGLITDYLSVKAGYAYMTQYVHLLSNSSVSLPTDLWVPVTKRIEPMKSHQISLGVFYNLKNWVDLSVEGYYKRMNNLIEYKDGASFLGSTTGWEDKVCMGRGWSYGVEFLAQRSVGKTTGWVAYTWSKSERLFDRSGEELNFGKPFPAKYDRRHDISITCSHKFSERFDIAGTWVYSTGNCGTLALQYYPQENAAQNGLYYISEVPYISSRNNFRYNAYHRLDLGVNFHKKKKHGIRTWNISVYNAYNRKNPFLVYPSSDYENGVESKVLKQVSIFPIIPSVSYSFKF